MQHASLHWSFERSRDQKRLGSGIECALFVVRVPVLLVTCHAAHADLTCDATLLPPRYGRTCLLNCADVSASTASVSDARSENLTVKTFAASGLDCNETPVSDLVSRCSREVQ